MAKSAMEYSSSSNDETLWVCPYCDLDSAGNHEQCCPTKYWNEKQIPYIQYGWVCPLCGAANAPFITQCSCQQPHIYYYYNY